MPRIRTSCSDPIDFCRSCFPSEDDAEEEYGDVGEGPDGRGNCFAYEDEHPPYEDDEYYRCATCDVRLTERDN